MSVSGVSLLELKSGRVRPTTREQPQMSSASAGWKGFFIEEQHGVDRESTDVCWTQHQIVLFLDQPLHLEWRCQGDSIYRTLAPGQISVMPASLPFSSRVRSEGTILYLSIDPKFFTRVAAEMGYENGLEPRCTHGAEDPLVREIILALRKEARTASSDQFAYVESLVTTLSVHLLRHYCEAPQLIRETAGGLTKLQMSRVIDYVHEHLAQDISLRKLATFVELSPFHFARLFRKSTGLSPHQFVIRCRVLRAKELLLQPGTSIAQVATEVGFCDQSHLSAHFKRYLGVSPKRFARSAVSRPEPPQPRTFPRKRRTPRRVEP